MMSGTVLRDIDEMWQDELFAPPTEEREPVGGMRVTHFQNYMDHVDWTDQRHATRALRVFEVALRPVFNPGPDWTPPPERVERLRKLFARDGYEITDEGRIVQRVVPVIAQELLSNLDDPDVILDHLARISSAVTREDAAQVIGSAKELIESTAKLVISATGGTVPKNADVPDLVKQAEEALCLHPKSVKSGPDGSEAVRKILGGATTVALRVAELRNQGYGTGHGQGSRRVGLAPRHARLAVNAARLWCELMLDTLADENAPWRKSEIA